MRSDQTHLLVLRFDAVGNSKRPAGAAAAATSRRSVASDRGLQGLFPGSTRQLPTGHRRRWGDQDLQHRPAVLRQASGLGRGRAPVAQSPGPCGGGRGQLAQRGMRAGEVVIGSPLFKVQGQVTERVSGAPRAPGQPGD